jgi:NDP-sugar pyrophosphorylase family protein
MSVEEMEPPLNGGKGPGAAGGQVVILAGGPGTRLGSLTQEMPKSMVPVGGRPFIEHQLVLLRSGGIDDFVLCVGYHGDMIQRHLGTGERWGVSIRYSFDGERLLGTGGALKGAESLLASEFLLVYGDSYVPLDYQDVIARIRRSNQMGLMVVYRNEDRYDRSNVELEGRHIKVYDKTRRTQAMVYIDAGVMALRREALSLIPAQTPYPLELLLQDLVRRGELLAYETDRRFYEVGSLTGLEEFRRLAASGAVPT